MIQKNDSKHSERNSAGIYQGDDQNSDSICHPDEELGQKKPESATLSQTNFLEEFNMLKKEIRSLCRSVKQEAR